jgi:hypothetical protein
MKTLDEALDLFSMRHGKEEFVDKIQGRMDVIKEIGDNDTAHRMAEDHMNMLMIAIGQLPRDGSRAGDVEVIAMCHLMSMLVTGILLGIEMEKQELPDLS